MADDGDGVELAIGGEFLKGGLGSHAAGKPGFHDGSGAAFFSKDFSGLLGAKDRAGENEIGDEVVFAKEGSDAVGLFDALWNEGANEVTAGEPVGVGGGVSDEIEGHVGSTIVVLLGTLAD